MVQTADSVSRAHGSSHLFAPRRLTLRGQSKQSLLLRFRPRLRRGSFVLTLIRGSPQMSHPWLSAAQSASMPIAPRISARTQPSPTSRSAVFLLSRYKSASVPSLHWIARRLVYNAERAWERSVWSVHRRFARYHLAFFLRHLPEIRREQRTGNVVPDAEQRARHCRQWREVGAGQCGAEP